MLPERCWKRRGGKCSGGRGCLPGHPSHLDSLSLPAGFSPPGPLTLGPRPASSPACLPPVSPLQTSPTRGQRHLLGKESITLAKLLVLTLLLTSSLTLHGVTPPLSTSLIFVFIFLAEPLRGENETPHHHHRDVAQCLEHSRCSVNGYGAQMPSCSSPLPRNPQWLPIVLKRMENAHISQPLCPVPTPRQPHLSHTPQSSHKDMFPRLFSTPALLHMLFQLRGIPFPVFCLPYLQDPACVLPFPESLP